MLFVKRRDYKLMRIEAVVREDTKLFVNEEVIGEEKRLFVKRRGYMRREAVVREEKLTVRLIVPGSIGQRTKEKRPNSASTRLAENLLRAGHWRA